MTKACLSSNLETVVLWEMKREPRDEVALVMRRDDCKSKRKIE